MADGVTVAACTPHILPGLYDNSGPQIRQATAQLQRPWTKKAFPAIGHGADNHISVFVAVTPGHCFLSVRYAIRFLAEPIFTIALPRVEEFFQRVGGGYVPIPTHPERLTSDAHYTTIKR